MQVQKKKKKKNKYRIALQIFILELVSLWVWWKEIESIWLIFISKSPKNGKAKKAFAP